MSRLNIGIFLLSYVNFVQSFESKRAYIREYINLFSHMYCMIDRMGILKLKLNTITPIGNFIEFNQHPIVLYGDFVFFINLQKLDKVLSLLKNLYDFNEYYNGISAKNITAWLKSKGLLSMELLEEVSYYRLRREFFGKIVGVYRFFQKSGGYMSPDSMGQYLSKYFLCAIKNIFLYEYFSSNNERLNDYVKKLLDFFDKKPKAMQAISLDILIKSIFELDRINFNFQLNYFDRIFLKLQEFNSSLEECFCLIKTTKGVQSHLQECFRSGLSGDFELYFDDDCKILENIDGYLSLSQELTNKRIAIENKNNKLPKDKVFPCEKVNFCFLTTSQIFYMNLSEENRTRLNSKLEEQYPEQYGKEIFYFDLEKESLIRTLNYAQIILEE